MISTIKLSKYYGATPVFVDIDIEINDFEKVGIVGSNGCGKTTLFNVLSKKIDFDSGVINIKKDKKLGILDQMPVFNSNTTAEDILKSAFFDVLKLIEKATILENKMAQGDLTEIDEYSKILQKIEACDGYNLEYQIDKVCNGLSIPKNMRNKHFSLLSGGEKTRINLARIILEQNDILLLDEPTNHLDMNATMWLTDFLKAYKGTVLTISHDRFFLDEVVDKIYELKNHKCELYLGNYSYYITEKEEREKRMLEEHLRTSRELKKLQDTSTKMHSWGTERMHKRAFSIDKRIAKMKVTDRPTIAKKIKVTFTNTDYQTEELLKFRSLSKSFENKKLFENLSFEVNNGDRVAIIGDNGTGKSTLIKILLNLETADSGTIKRGIGLKMGYLPQIVSFENDQRNLIDTLIYEKNVTTQTARNRLGSFKFSGEDQLKTVRKLSGGEKSRLKLCTLMYDDVNLLILDEPTNHIDVLSKEWIEEALLEYDGSLIFVSHDRYFISRFATKILEFENGTYTLFKGSYDEYLQTKNELKLTKTKEIEPKKSDKKPTNTNQSLDKETGKKIRVLEREIANLDEQIANIELEMSQYANDFAKLYELQQLKDELDMTLLSKMEQWDKFLGG